MREKITQKKPFDPALGVVLFFILSYVVYFTLYAVTTYQTYGFRDYDLAIHAQMAWNLLHGVPAGSIMLDMSLFGGPLWLVSFLTAPLYKLFPTPLTLLILQNIFLGMSALPLYFLAKEEIGEEAAGLIACAYLFYPALWFVNSFEYHPVALSIPFSFLAFYFLKKQRFWKYFFTLLFILLCRADLSPVVFMLGVYAFLDKRSLRWSLTPLALGLLWMVVGVGIIVPMFSSPDIRYDVYYSHFGHGFQGAVENMVLHPGHVFSFLAKKQNLVFLWELFSPVLFLSFAAFKELAICLPSLMQHLLSSRPAEHTINFHYTVPVIPFVFISFIYGLAKLFKMVPSWLRPRFPRLAGMFFFCFSLLANISFGPILEINRGIAMHIKTNSFNRQLDQMLKMIPADAPVTTTFQFLPKLSNRRYLYSFHHLYSGLLFPGSKKLYRAPENIEYALVNFADPLMLGSFNRKNSDILMRDFFSKDNWGVVSALDNVVLLKKGDKDGKKLYEVTHDVQGKVPKVIVAGALELQDFSFSPDPSISGKFNIIFVFRCKKETKDSFWMRLFLENGQKKTVYILTRPVCYGVYPTSRWKEGEVVKDHLSSFFPKELPKGRYFLKASFYPKRRGAEPFLQANTSNLIDEKGKIILGELDLRN